MTFKAGQSGNPRGPKPGTSRGINDALRAKLDACSEAAWSNLERLLAEGDWKATEYVLVRLIPPLRAVDRPVTIPFPTESSLSGKALAVVDAVVEGIVAPDVGNTVLAGIRSAVEVVDAVDYHDALDTFKEATQKTRKPWESSP